MQSADTHDEDCVLLCGLSIYLSAATATVATPSHYSLLTEALPHYDRTMLARGHPQPDHRNLG